MRLRRSPVRVVNGERYKTSCFCMISTIARTTKIGRNNRDVLLSITCSHCSCRTPHSSPLFLRASLRRILHSISTLYGGPTWDCQDGPKKIEFLSFLSGWVENAPPTITDE